MQRTRVVEHIDVVHVTVQSAEITLIGHDTDPNLVVNGTLKNVERGHVVLTLQPAQCRAVGIIGTLEIEENRPVMQASVTVGRSQFDTLISLLSGTPPRPASVLLALRERLILTEDGYLQPDTLRHCSIVDISWSIPVQ